MKTKFEVHRTRRTKQGEAERKTQLEARSLQSAGNQNIQNNSIKKVDLEPSACLS